MPDGNVYIKMNNTPKRTATEVKKKAVIHKKTVENKNKQKSQVNRMQTPKLKKKKKKSQACSSLLYRLSYPDHVSTLHFYRPTSPP
jgi:hypothetical protein